MKKFKNKALTSKELINLKGGVLFVCYCWDHRTFKYPFYDIPLQEMFDTMDAICSGNYTCYQEG